MSIRFVYMRKNIDIDEVEKYLSDLQNRVEAIEKELQERLKTINEIPGAKFEYVDLVTAMNTWEEEAFYSAEDQLKASNPDPNWEPTDDEVKRKMNYPPQDEILLSRITTAVKKLTEVQKYLAASLNDIGYSQAKVAKIAHTSQARVGRWIRSVEGDLPPRAKRPW